MKKQIAVVAAMLALSLNCQAEGLRPVVGASITGGGETLLELHYTDGSTQKIRSGGFLHMFGGAEYEFDKFALQANIGYHVDDSTAKNGSAKFSRWPVELIGLWKIDSNLRAGVGVRKATGAKISSSGALSLGGSIDLESKAGFIVQGEYLFTPQMSVLVRYVNESYEIGRSIEIQGNHVGLGASYRF